MAIRADANCSARVRGHFQQGRLPAPTYNENTSGALRLLRRAWSVCSPKLNAVPAAFAVLVSAVAAAQAQKAEPVVFTVAPLWIDTDNDDGSEPGERVRLVQTARNAGADPVDLVEFVAGEAAIGEPDPVGLAAKPAFDCGDIIGRVFADLNRNGGQDKGEPGLPGVRLASADGLLVKTDEHGRFHVACADLPDRTIGATFVMKLDPRTLPSGYRVVSENPRAVRLSAGKVSRINFATTIGRVVRLDVDGAAFEPGAARLTQEWQMQLSRLVEVLEVEESILRLAYVDMDADRRLAAARAKYLRRVITKLWKQKPGRYRLEIESRVKTPR